MTVHPFFVGSVLLDLFCTEDDTGIGRPFHPFKSLFMTAKIHSMNSEKHAFGLSNWNWMERLKK